MSRVLAIFGNREGVETPLVVRYNTCLPLNDFDVFVYFTNPHPRIQTRSLI